MDPGTRAAETVPLDLEDGTELEEPGRLSVGGGYAFVADTGNHRVVRVPLGGDRARIVEVEPSGVG